MKNIKSKKSKKLNKIFVSVLFAILSIAGGLYGIGNYMQARAAGAPSVLKKVVPNGDGTYTISLDVKGDAEKNYNKANVIVILDSSGSMKEATTSKGYYPSNTNGDNMYGYVDGNYVKLERHGGWWGNPTYYTYEDSNGNDQTYTGTRYLYSDAENRMAAAKGAVTDLARALLANNAETGSASDLIEIALIDFDTNATIVQQPTTSIDTFLGSLADVEQGGGTNWEAALQKAADIDFADPANEKNTTYVIFVSDGNPTFHITDDGYNDYNYNYRVYGTGQEEEPNVTNCYNSAIDDARVLVNPKKYEFYTIGVYGDVDRMEDLTKYALNTTEDVEDKNYFKAEDTFKLQEALNKILQKIELAGFSDITVNDGTTKNVSVSSGTEQGGLIDVDTNSFKYYLSFPITVNGNTITSGAERIKSIEKNSDGTYKITNDKNQVFNNVVRVPELDDNGNEIATIFKMAWTSGENNPFYDRTAPEAELDSNNAVVWNLDDLGVLYDEVTYRVTFDVWPSQAALDLIADLKNGKITYGASTDDQGRPIDPKVWTYLDRNYGIKTNTNEAYVEYTDTRVENDTTHRVNFQTQDPIASASTKVLTVAKEWENTLDSRNSTDISLKVKRGTETRYAVELPLKDEDGNRILDEDENPIWSNSIFASVGIMTIHDGVVSLKTQGHDYSFAEEQEIAYYWELDAPTVHPMWINGEVDNEGNPVTTMLIKQDGKPTGMADDAATATIDGKTYYKIGNSYYVVDNQLATLTATNNRRSYLQITKDVDGKDAPADALFTYNVKVTDSEGKTVWFSIYNPDTKEYIMNKPGSETEPAINYISGTGVAPEVKLLIEKPEYAQNFRNINHTNGSDVITYEYCDHADAEKDCSANGADWKSYTVKYVSGNSNDTYRYYTGFYTAPNATDLTILIQKGWSIRFINLPTETNYEVTESKMPEHFSFVSVAGDGTVDEGNKKKVTGKITETNTGYEITYTNKYELTSVKVTKDWQDNENQDGKRVPVTFSLYANNVKLDNMSVTVDGTPDEVTEANKDKHETAAWKALFDNLDRFDENGEEIEYTVDEDSVPEGYDKVGITGDINSGFVISNKHVPEKYDDGFDITKTWIDFNNKNNIRPESITIKLVGTIPNGESTKKVYEKEVAIGTNTEGVTVSKDDNNNDVWTYTFKKDDGTNLDKYAEGELITYTLSEKTIIGYKEPSIENYAITNTLDSVSIPVTKEWADDSDRDGVRPDNVKLTLKANNQELETVTVNKQLDSEGKGLDSWTYTFENLNKYDSEGKIITYTVVELEKNVPEGYETSSGCDDDGNTIIYNTHEIATDDVTVTKVWEDDSDRDGERPEKITLILKADGEVVDRIELDATKGDTQSYTFPDMPVNHDGGTPIVYTADEASVPTNYSKDTDDTDLTVTNSYSIDTDNITVTKVWDDDSDRDGKRPEKVTLVLKADGEVVDRIELDATNGDTQSYTFPNMPANKDHGTPIVYTADELTVPAGYTKDDNDKDLTVTNSYKIVTKNITVKKVWDDASNSDGQRPETGATIHLLDGTTPIEGKSVTLKPGESGVIVSQDGNTLSYTFINVPVYKDGGTEIKYGIKEDRVSGYNEPLYSSTDNGNTLIVTNPYTTDTVDITVTKVWDDDSDRDGLRPETVTLLVLDGTVEVDRHTINAKNGDEMSWTFTGLPKYKNGGTPITYKVDEVTVNGYGKDIDNDNYIITNSKDYETINIPFTKEWKDENDQDGLRPTCEEGGITVNLLDGTNVVASKTVCGDGDTWSGSFDKMPKYKNHGEKITYTLQEVGVKGYTSAVSGNVITNTHTPELISVEGSKVWVDAENIEGFRPIEDGITVKLYADGTEIDSQVVKGTGDKWAYSFSKLPKYKDHGKEIKYTVSEDPVENYEEPDYISATGDENKKYVIVNTHNPKNVTITAKKVWKDTSETGETNIYGHPDTVDIILTGSVGEETIVSEPWTLSSEEVDDDGNWTHTFTDLPEYRNGMLVTYMVDEVPSVKDYHKDVTPETKDGVTTFTVTNTYEIEDYTVISGSKTWNDDDDRDGLRPDAITIKVTDQFGNVVVSKDVTEEDNWEYEIKLPKYGYSETEEDFVELTYEVTEVGVDGYETKVSGYNVTNTHEIATVSYHITKVWTDNTDNDGLRPEEITVHIIDEDTEEEYGTAIMSAENKWYYEFDNLPKYKNGGEEIKYKIIEDPVAGYTYTFRPTEENNGVDYILENTHEDSLIDIIIKKIWDDNDDVSQIRPNEIIVDLLIDNEVVDTLTITSEDGWEGAFTNLNEFDGGVKIEYVVREREIPEYETSYSVDGNTYTITNHHELGKGNGPEEEPPQTGIIYNKRGVFIVLMNMFGLSFAVRRTKED